MSTNPFDDIAQSLAVLTAKVDEINAKVSKPAPEWEPIAQAIASRKKARRTIMAAVSGGQVLSRTVPNQYGRDSLQLRVFDLDRVFPVRL